MIHREEVKRSHKNSIFTLAQELSILPSLPHNSDHHYYKIQKISNALTAETFPTSSVLPPPIGSLRELELLPRGKSRC